MYDISMAMKMICSFQSKWRIKEPITKIQHIPYEGLECKNRCYTFLNEISLKDATEILFRYMYTLILILNNKMLFYKKYIFKQKEILHVYSFKENGSKIPIRNFLYMEKWNFIYTFKNSKGRFNFYSMIRISLHLFIYRTLLFNIRFPYSYFCTLWKFRIQTFTQKWMQNKYVVSSLN